MRLEIVVVAAAFRLVWAQNTTTPEPSTTTTTVSTENTTSTTTAIPASGLPVLEIVIIAVGLFIVLFASFRMSRLIRQYSSASAPEGMAPLFLIRILHIVVDPVACAVCTVRQGIPRGASVFVCYSCHSANFVERENGLPVRNFSPSPTSSGKRVSLHRITDTFYKLDPNEEGPTSNAISNEVRPEQVGAQTVVEDPGLMSPRTEPLGTVDGDATQCNICMDAHADTVMMPCAHGGICYKCADALVRTNLITGGAKCIHCRADIVSLVRLSEMNDQVASGVQIDIPKAMMLVRRH